MAQIFRPAADTILRVTLAAVAAGPVLGIGVVYAVMRSPYTTGEGITREQPVPFSHEHHVGGLGLDCRYCHAGVETARYAGMPPTETCMTCHSQLWTQARMLAPVRESFARKQPLHWRWVNSLPDYVYFNHAVHVTKGVGCSTCHGPVDRMPLMRQAAPLTMGWCLDCHRDPGPQLRPLAAVFDLAWVAPDNQEDEGRRFIALRHIEPAKLTECSRCHR